MIKLDKYFTLDREPHCWSLKYESTKTKVIKGESKTVKDEHTTYHMDITQALGVFINSSLKANSDTAEMLLSEIKKLYKLIENTKIPSS